MPGGMERIGLKDLNRFEPAMRGLVERLGEQPYLENRYRGIVVGLDGQICAGKSSIGRWVQGVNQACQETMGDSSSFFRSACVGTHDLGWETAWKRDSSAARLISPDDAERARTKGFGGENDRGDALLALPKILAAARKDSRLVFMPETAHRAVLGTYLEHPKELAASMQSRMWNDAMHRQVIAAGSVTDTKDGGVGPWVVLQDRTCVGNAAIAVANGALGCMDDNEMKFYKVGTRQIPHLAHGLDVVIYVDTSVQGCIRRLPVRGDAGEADAYQDAYFCAVERAHLAYFLAEAQRISSEDALDSSYARVLKGWTVIQEESCATEDVGSSLLDVMERFAEAEGSWNRDVVLYPIAMEDPDAHRYTVKRARSSRPGALIAVSSADLMEIHRAGERGDDTLRMRAMVSASVVAADERNVLEVLAPGTPRNFVIEAYPVDPSLVNGAFLTRSRGIRRWLFSVVALGHRVTMPSVLPVDDEAWVGPFLEIASR